jgi:organic hydroperoxide reductase OsmC/OhrA
VAVQRADEQLLRRLYAAFNARDVEAVLAAMRPDVDWPNVIEGTRAVGRDAVRAYWAAQFAAIDPRVEPVGFRDAGEGRVAVDVHQIVRDLDGAVRSDGRVVHVYTLQDGFVVRMDVAQADVAQADLAPAPPVHRYRARTACSGSTAAGYDAYERAHEASCPPAQAALGLSSDPAFHGDPTKPNPEQLLVLAASSCQLLSFLAVAARARVEVTGYEDDAEGVMPEDDPPLRITRIVLRPRITVAGDTPEARLRRLVETAHEHCFIAQSLRSEVVVEPIFVRAGDRAR